METVILLLILIMIGMIGFILVKKVDVFLENSRNGQIYTLEDSEDDIKIVCENPIMLSYVVDKIEKQKKEFKRISFYFYTGCKEDIEKALQEQKYDIFLLTVETGSREYAGYEKKISCFLPASISELFTGMAVEPLQNQKTAMYVLCNKKYITETKQKIISII